MALPKKVVCGVVYLVVLVASATAQAAPHFIIGSGVVYRAVDGDTFIVNVDHPAIYQEIKALASTPEARKYLNDKYQSFRIRLAATDTEESKHKDKWRNTEAGKETARYVARITEKRSTQFACWTLGDHHRVICSMEIAGQDLGLHLIEGGFSPYVTYFGKHPYLHEVYQAAANRR